VTQPSPYFIQRNGPPRDDGPELEPRNISFLEDEEGTINLEQYWHAIRKRLSLILGIVFAAILLTTVHEFMQTPLYTAETTVILKPGTPQMLQEKDSSQMDINAGDSDDEMENFKKTQYEILKSRSLAATVVQNQNLEHNPDFVGRKPAPGLLSKLKTKLKRSTSIIGFLSHLQGDLKAKAVEAGCDTVMPRAAFSQNLPQLLRRHGAIEAESGAAD